jgi:hypothetical protein
VTGLAATPDGALYAGTKSGAILTHAAGTWNVAHQGATEVVRLSVLSGGRLAAIYTNGVIEVLRDGIWTIVEPRMSRPTNVVSSVATPQELYIAGAAGLATSAGAVVLDGETTGALVLLAGKPEVILCGTDGPLQRSDDGGVHFMPVAPPVDVAVLVTPLRYQDQVFAGTGAGELWFSRDRGRSWNRLHAGMAQMRDLSFARVI